MTYTPRKVDCPECWGEGYAQIGAFGTVGICDYCEGRRTVDAQCAECGRIESLDDEGYCEKCVDASSLPLADFNIKYPPTGWALAELRAVQRRAA